MTLVIMAAGMGSRFGGLKQIEPVGRAGEFILDYSVYDALRAGFDKVVFIIKEENYELFRDTVGKRIENKIEARYVFQKNINLPAGVVIPEDRKSPLGTGLAILCCKDTVKEDFLVLNADDFYGFDAFRVAADFIRGAKKENDFAMVGYMTGNTMSENGSVKRGVCESEGGYLTDIIESSIELAGGKIIARPLNGDAEMEVPASSPVSMNMFVFTPKIFDFLEKLLAEFFEENADNLAKAEFLLPEAVRGLVKAGEARVKILPTTAKWYGITYREDKEAFIAEINKLIDSGAYPEELWN